MENRESYEIVKLALEKVARNCDGACQLDGSGFNKMDSHFGKTLATTPFETWTLGMIKAGLKLAIKYGRQHTYEVKSLPTITDEEIEKAKEIRKTERLEKTKPRLALENNVLTAQFEYNAALVAAVKELPKRKYEAEKKCWSIQIIFENVEGIERLINEHGFEAATEVTELISKLKSEKEFEAIKKTENLEASKRAEGRINVAGLRGELRPFQRAGVEYALANKRVFIADEMGLGKTIQAIATIQARELYPAIVVCPASLKYNWKKECEKWLPENKYIEVLNGTNATSKYFADVVIINYDVLGKNLEQLKERNFQAVVFDEFHYAKNGKANRTKAAKEIALKAEYVLGLTGTPVVNRPAELISPLQILNRLDKDFGGFWEFVKRYTGAYRGRFGLVMDGARNLEELNEKLRASCYIRRNKKDVLTELPDKVRSEQFVELSNQKEYNRAEAELIAYLKDESIKDIEFLESIAGLPKDEQLLAKHARMEEKAEKAKRAEHLVRFEALKQLAAKGKLEAVYEWMDNFLETGEKLVLFATHKSVIAEVCAKYGCNKITGDTPAEARQKYVEDFQNNPETKLLALNIKAGGVGLTLTAASNVAFIELGWTPADHDQAEDRIHRIGQKNTANVWYFLAPDTIDDYIYTLINEKRKVVTAATDGQTPEAAAGGIMNDLINKLINK